MGAGWAGTGRRVVAAVVAVDKEPAGRESGEFAGRVVRRHRVPIRGHTASTENQGCSSVGIYDWSEESEELLAGCTVLAGHSWWRSSGAGRTNSTAPARDGHRS